MKYEGTIAVAPPQDRLAARLQESMLWILAFFVFALPLVEAPKNLAAGLFLVTWLARAVRTRDFGGGWSRYDTVFATILGSAVLSGLAGYAGDLGGVFRVVLIAWAISRTPIRTGGTQVLMASSIAGAVLAIVLAAVPFLRGTREFLELPSVGQVNQSALYVAILAVAAFGWWIQLARTGLRSRARTWLAASAAVIWLALLVGASRGAIVAALAPLPLLVVAAWGKARRDQFRKLTVRAALILALMVALVAALTAWAPQLSDGKLRPDRIFGTYSMSHRVHHWRIAYEGWRERPWLGWGPDAFQRITVDEVCTWRARRGEACDRELYVPTKHAHSLYMATLSERGMLGVLALAMLLAAWAWSLARSWRSAATSPLWPASLGGLAVVVIGGVFNTTLRVEHGSLALALFGLWVAVHARPAPTGRC